MRIAILGFLVSFVTAALAGPSAEPPGTNPRVLDLAPYAGKVVLVDFWASWCGPCAESFPWMAEMVERYGPQGLVVVAVALDEDVEAASRFLAERAAPFEHVHDPEGALAERYDVDVMPTSILFDRLGRPAFVHDGFRLECREEYERHIRALLDGNVEGDPALLAETGDGRRGPGVRPWQRAILAQDAMRLDADPLDLAIDDHIYFSKEASSGGRGFGGGGCGCN